MLLVLIYFIYLAPFPVLKPVHRINFTYLSFNGLLSVLTLSGQGVNHQFLMYNYRLFHRESEGVILLHRPMLTSFVTKSPINSCIFNRISYLFASDVMSLL